VLVEAWATAGRLFESIGVDVAPGGEVGCSRFVLVRISSGGWAGRRRLTGTALGFATVGGDTAYVVYERVKQYATDRRYGLSAVLGLVMAHEIGHLLIGDRAHATIGLMRAAWSDKDFRRAEAGGLGFTSEDSRSIRTGLAGRD
jgi:hypothetical protein